jgi:magnesium chelatase subunit H
MVLWGTDNLKSEGGPIGQALALIGATPRFDSYGRLAGAQLVPLAQLGRPRVDVVITLSGIFRDLLPLQIKLLAEAAYLAASADEPDDRNFIRKHALAYQAEHGGDLETASLRVFGTPRVPTVPMSACWWQRRWDARTSWLRPTPPQGLRLRPQGRPVQNALLHGACRCGTGYQNLDSVARRHHYRHLLRHAGGISRAVKRAAG